MDHRNPILKHDAGVVSPRNLGTFTKMVPGTFALLLALGLVPEAIYEEENHSVEHITTFQSIIFHLK